jgi:hypothetical protein
MIRRPTIDAVPFLDEAAREKILERNVRRVYPRLDALLDRRRLSR